MQSRRSFLKTGSATLLNALTMTGTAFAGAPTDKRLILIFLRGGMDGLHALPPYEDRDYKALRPHLAQKAQREGGKTIDLDGYFGLHEGLTALHPMYQAGDLLFVPAAATQYRARSHFDGQNMLENGSGVPDGAKDGWLNRAILGLNEGDHRLGLALGPSVPLILTGAAEVHTWSKSPLPEVDADFLQTLSAMYQSDAQFLDALHDATGALDPNVPLDMFRGNPASARNFPLSARAAADLLSRADGPRIATMELQGWDTHFGQNGRLMSLFKQVSKGVLELRNGLGPLWPETVVMVVSEFGRTAAENASKGTDHGTGGLAMLAGGGIGGGRIMGNWPGLSPKALYQDRDLRAVNDYEGLFKAVLSQHMGLDLAYIEDRVFPNSRALAPMDGLLRI